MNEEVERGSFRQKRRSKWKFLCLFSLSVDLRDFCFLPECVWTKGVKRHTETWQEDERDGRLFWKSKGISHQQNVAWILHRTEPECSSARAHVLHRSVSICVPVRISSPSHMGAVICVSADVLFADMFVHYCCGAGSVCEPTWMSVNMMVWVSVPCLHSVGYVDQHNDSVYWGTRECASVWQSQTCGWKGIRYSKKQFDTFPFKILLQ